MLTRLGLQRLPVPSPAWVMLLHYECWPLHSRRGPLPGMYCGAFGSSIGEGDSWLDKLACCLDWCMVDRIRWQSLLYLSPMSRQLAPCPDENFLSLRVKPWRVTG